MASYDNNRLPDINTAYPGFAYNFDPVTQTCDVQLAIESLFVGMIEPYKLEVKERLVGVEVRFTQGGGWSFTHPVPDGTPVWVSFAQRGTSHYFSEGKDTAGLLNGKPAPQFSQLYDINSAVCEVGYQPANKVIKDFQNGLAELRNADRSQRISLNGDGSVSIVSGKASILVSKDGDIAATSTTKIIATAPQIVLDGDTTVTKSLTVQGGANFSGGSGSTFKVTGDMEQVGSYTLNGIKVDNHTHSNPEGGNVGVMKAS